MGEAWEHRDFVSGVDVMPSLLKLLSGKVPAGMDGCSWLPVPTAQPLADGDSVLTHVITASSGKAFYRHGIPLNRGTK